MNSPGGLRPRIAFTLLVGLFVPFGCGCPTHAGSKGEALVARAYPNATRLQVTADQPAKLQVPVGTVLPVRLNNGFSSKDAHVGQSITGRIMQDVPLPDGNKIPEGAKVLGVIDRQQQRREDLLPVQRNRTPSSAD